MLIPVAFSLLLALGYAALMMAYRRGWALQDDFVLPAGYELHTRISVIIPARNEAGNIGKCIEAVLAQNYPVDLFEVIVVDDHSTDNTTQVVNTYAHKNVRCIHLADHINKDEAIVAFKKKAIAVGIEQSKGELIITTDADCAAPVNWLRNIAAVYEQTQPVMIVAPVVFTSNNSMVENFQLLDFMGMQGITGGAMRLQLGNMSNGANLAFSKAAYLEVNGYSGVDHLASGDDYLLMMKLNKAFPGKIVYLKSAGAIVSTPPQPSWQGFFQQRIRWASKSGKYDDKKLNLILIFVYLFNVSFLILFIAAFFKPVLFAFILLLLAIKVFSELFFIVPVAAFFGKQSYLLRFVFFQPLHIMYVILAGFLGFFGGYEWKGRKVR